ncbi:chemotaxis protein [Shouchella clausii]|uniref:chemotaxis protein n=1 Tax=Shouchella clausii TaxID=79880 RepID=UPI00280AC4F0|nr:chemotaxis protein [Shouchella clausii]WMM31753.1 chemotaxis protein [Shouchella clausii]
MALNIFQTEEQRYDQELVLFKAGQSTYALNVLKVKEIIRPVPVTESPNRHSIVEGVIQVRGQVIPLINLYRLLEIDESETVYFLVIEMGEQLFALKTGPVSHVHRTHSSIIKQPDAVTKGKEAFVSGVIPLPDNGVAFSLDLEKVLHFIQPSHMQGAMATDERRRNYPLLLVEDSKTLRSLLVDALREAGYEDVTTFDNGRDASRYLTDDACPLYEAIVTDIEMPYMNGHELTRHLRQDSRYQETPVIAFSSLDKGLMERRGEEAGVTEHVAKPDIHQLVDALDRQLLEKSESI